MLTPPFGATTLAPDVWSVDGLLALDEARAIRDHVLATPQYACPLQEAAAWPRKRCAKIALPAPLQSRLAGMWPSLKQSALTEVAASIDEASADDRSMRHHFHRDVFPERDAAARGPDATAVLYLTEAPQSHPAELSGATLFPRHDVRVVPKVGRLLLWSNVDEDGGPNVAAEHGVGPYVGAHLPARVALHLPIARDVAQPEHVGCGGMPRWALAVRYSDVSARWLRVVQQLLSDHRV